MPRETKETHTMRCQILELKEKLKQATDRVNEYERILIKLGYKQPSEAKTPGPETAPLFGVYPDDTPEADEQEDEDSSDYTQKRKRKKRKKGSGRKGLPENLERREKRYEPNTAELPDYDPTRGYQVIGWDRSEELMYIPAQFYVLVHLRPIIRYFSECIGDTVLVTQGETNKVFSKCMASPELLAKIAIDRLDRCLSLYRIERWFVDHGCPLARSTLCVWMVKLGQLLRPICDAQMRDIQNAFKIHVDDTNVAIIDKEGKGRTQDQKVWVLIDDDPLFTQKVFRHTRDRTKEAVRLVLAGFECYLQVDACGVYDEFFNTTNAIEVGCWSHVFRKFKEICGYDSRALSIMKKIRRLCDVEDASRDHTPEQRYRLRLATSAYLLDELKEYVEKERDLELLESRYKKALNYIHNQWPHLTRYLEDGRLRMDNNLAESEFHNFGVTRRNHLFWGEEGLRSGLVLLSLIRTCRSNGIDPTEYLVDVIRKVAETNMTAEELTPKRWWQSKQVELEEGKASACR